MFVGINDGNQIPYIITGVVVGVARWRIKALVKAANIIMMLAQATKSANFLDGILLLDLSCATLTFIFIFSIR